MSNQHEPTSPAANSASPTDFSFANDSYQRNAHRFPAWMALTVFSAVCTAALGARRDIFNAEDTWPFLVTIVSLILGFGSVVSYLMFRPVFVGQLAEIIVVSLLLGFWSSALPIIMDPNKNIAVVPPRSQTTEVAPTVLNANLYFFSWGSLAAVIYLTGSLLQEYWGVNVRSTPAKSARWYGITASALVVLGSSVPIFQAADCSEPQNTNDEIQFCRRSKLAIAMGVIGFVFAASMTLLIQKMQLTVLADFCITTFQLTMWCFAVGYITFGASPGATIGNLYFSTWLAFLLSVFLFAQSFREYVASREQAYANNTNADNHDNARGIEARQETYDDAI